MRERHGGEAIWPFQGTGTLGYLQGLEGRAGRAAVERARRQRAQRQHLLDRRLGRPALHDRLEPRHGPGGVPAREADPAVGLQPADEPPPHLEVHRRSARATAPISSRSTRSARAARARPTSTSPRARAPTRRSRSACMHEVVGARRARRGVPARALRRLGRVPRPARRVPARARGGDLRPAARSGSSRSASGWPRTRPTAIRATMGIQRHAGGGMALRTLASDPGRDRRLGAARRRPRVLDQRLLPRRPRRPRRATTCARTRSARC